MKICVCPSEVRKAGRDSIVSVSPEQQRAYETVKLAMTRFRDACYEKSDLDRIYSPEILSVSWADDGSAEVEFA